MNNQPLCQDCLSELGLSVTRSHSKSKSIVPLSLGLKIIESQMQQQIDSFAPLDSDRVKLS